jgi:hypothetical protein
MPRARSSAADTYLDQSVTDAPDSLDAAGERRQVRGRAGPNWQRFVLSVRRRQPHPRAIPLADIMNCMAKAKAAIAVDRAKLRGAGGVGRVLRGEIWLAEMDKTPPGRRAHAGSLQADAALGDRRPGDFDCPWLEYGDRRHRLDGVRKSSVVNLTAFTLYPGYAWSDAWIGMFHGIQGGSPAGRTTPGAATTGQTRSAASRRWRRRPALRSAMLGHGGDPAEVQSIDA